MLNRRKNTDFSTGFYLALAAAGAIGYFVLRPRTSKSTDTASTDAANRESFASYKAATAAQSALSADPEIISASFGSDVNINHIRPMPQDRALQIQKNLRNFVSADSFFAVPLDGIYDDRTDFAFKNFVFWCISALKLKLTKEQENRELRAIYPMVDTYLGPFSLLGDNGIFQGDGFNCAINSEMVNEESDFEPWHLVYHCERYNGIEFKLPDGTAVTLLRSAYVYLSTVDIASRDCNRAPRNAEMDWFSDNDKDGCNYTVADRKCMLATLDYRLADLGLIT
jgi:hypothetical protein